MITYTDGDIAKQLNDDILSEDYAKQYEAVTNKPLTITDKLNLLIKADLAKLFPDLSIPEPMWIKQYYWSDGAAYWTSTNSTAYTKYNVDANDLSHYLGNKICNILNENQPNKLGKVYIVNENISVHQAWIEGCLQSVNDCMTTYINSNNNINKYTTNHSNHVDSSKYTANNKTRTHIRNMNGGKSNTKKASKAIKYYTMDDIKKHNKKTDAWLVINKKVYDVTKWVPDHPGGNIILKGVGKDATELYNTIHSHGVFANNVLKKYYIGKLKQ
jgi:cytochrome b involved in lipid metabolism